MVSYLVTILSLVAIISILGLALNLQWGLCGMVNFGIAGFFALGAYTAALVALAGGGTFLATLCAAIVCSIACAIVALVSLRLSDEYLAILTLGFGEVVARGVERRVAHPRIARSSGHSSPVLELDS